MLQPQSSVRKKSREKEGIWIKEKLWQFQQSIIASSGGCCNESYFAKFSLNVFVVSLQLLPLPRYVRETHGSDEASCSHIVKREVVGVRVTTSVGVFLKQTSVFVDLEIWTPEGEFVLESRGSTNTTVKKKISRKQDNKLWSEVLGLHERIMMRLHLYYFLWFLIKDSYPLI